jgi:hypothetical protein
MSQVAGEGSDWGRLLSTIDSLRDIFPPDPFDEDYVRIDEACRLTGLNYTRIHSHVKKGQIVTHRETLGFGKGSHVLYRKLDLMNLRARRNQEESKCYIVFKILIEELKRLIRANIEMENRLKQLAAVDHRQDQEEERAP